MAWEVDKDTDAVTQGNDSKTFTLNPGEGALIQVERQAGTGSTDDTFVGYVRSPDGVLFDVDPVWRRRVTPAQFPFSMSLRDPTPNFRIRIENAESSPVDTIICDVSVIKDGIDL